MNIESIQAAGSPPQAIQRETPSLKTHQDRGSAIETAGVENTQAKQQHLDRDGKQLSIGDAVERLANFVSERNSDINFTVDNASGVEVVKVIDRQTQEVIRQIPSKEAIQLAQALDKLQGLFIKDKA